MRKFAKTPTYQTIEILGQPAIYTDYRIEHTSVAPLKDRNTMQRFCELRGRVLNAEEAILPPCGFSIHTKNYQYMLR